MPAPAPAPAHSVGLGGEGAKSSGFRYRSRRRWRRDMAALAAEFGDREFVIVAVPCNQVRGRAASRFPPAPRPRASHRSGFCSRQRRAVPVPGSQHSGPNQEHFRSAQVQRWPPRQARWRSLALARAQLVLTRRRRSPRRRHPSQEQGKRQGRPPALQLPQGLQRGHPPRPLEFYLCAPCGLRLRRAGAAPQT